MPLFANALINETISLGIDCFISNFESRPVIDCDTKTGLSKASSGTLSRYPIYAHTGVRLSDGTMK